MRDPKLYLLDILKSIESIEKFIENNDYESLKNDDLRLSAILRKLEIIGEAAKNIPENIKQKYPNITWKDISGMRDRLIHFYFGVKFDLIWETIKKDLPFLKEQIKIILKELEN